MFFYKNSPLLRSFIAKVFAVSLINLHSIIHEPAGIGKTSSARAFAKLRAKYLRTEGLTNDGVDFQMYSFHGGIKSNHGGFNTQR